MDWFRWHHGTSKDPKWKVVARKAGVNIRDVIAVWATLNENASESSDRGTLQGWNPEDVGAQLDMEVMQVQAVFDAMQGKVLNGNLLTGFNKRNPKREREDDNSTERTRKWREKNKHVTPGDAMKRTDREIERKIEREKEELIQAVFEELWDRYPAKDGRKEAEKHFRATVKTAEDMVCIRQALDNYQAHLKANDWKRPKNGSTWFNNWRDWVDWRDPAAEPPSHKHTKHCAWDTCSEMRTQYNKALEKAAE